MEMLYKSTRGKSKPITSSEAIIKGIAEDGGLYVPETIPGIGAEFEELINYDYKELALYIIKKFLTDFEEKELSECIEKAYNEKFEAEEIVELSKKDDIFFLELYHGPTLAFKDMALSLLPHLLKAALKKHQITREVVILTATSGDTGKAALEGFANVDGTKIAVFYPESGVSDIQKRQMITQKGKNTFVAGIKGNFDDAQNGVKEIFNNNEYKRFLEDKGYLLSSANSINIGRLVPQIVYYFYAYLKMLRNKDIEKGERINFVVPTGNFGNILAAWYAWEMGLPVNRLICASNENNVLYDFINTGIYDMRREFKTTFSPSMDILISSNLERMNYYLSGEDSNLVSELMKRLGTEGRYEITKDMKRGLTVFHAGYATDDDTIESIREVYLRCRYVMDTHTAVAYSVYKSYAEAADDMARTVIVSTASPFKFTRSVCSSLGIDTDNISDFELIDRLSSKTGLNIPKAIEHIEDMEILHDRVCSREDMKKAIDEFLRV